jgi:hypothetical protein
VAKTTRWGEFPEDVRDTFEDVWQDVSSLHATWKLYLDLFGTTGTVQVLSEAAPAAFQAIETCIRSHMIMAFGRLIDPATQGIKDKPKENLSLERLAQVLRPHADLATSARWDRQVTTIQDQCKPISTWRNKRVGHKDRMTALESHANALPGISRGDVEKALGLLRDLLNDIQGHFQNGGETRYEAAGGLGTGEDLVDLLRVALDRLKREKGLNP